MVAEDAALVAGLSLMKIALLSRFRPVITALRGIHAELKRMNDIRELELAHQNLYIKAPKADTSGPEPEVTYTSEVEDYFRELAEEKGKVAKWEEE
jgi:hypothetical protein